MVHAARALDTTLYPETDDMGEGELQRLITELFRPLLARFLAERGVEAHVGADTFLYYEPFNSAARLAPDIYVLPGVPQETVARVWKLWELEKAPSFCMEIVSRDVGKDYEDVPPVHAKVGTRELVVFDPEARGRRGRFVWQVYKRTRRGLVLSEQTNTDRVSSRELRCFLRVTGKGDAQRVRIGTGAAGERLFPTVAEIAERERIEKERERAEKERERAEKEREREARLELEAEVRRLRAALERAKR